jgi:hypothetical protein
MLTVYGEGRGFRVVWLLEELGVAYRLRPVDLLAVENDPDFLAINPAGFIPALQDGETIMVESIAILDTCSPATARVHSPSPRMIRLTPPICNFSIWERLGSLGQ